ncbi:ClbS/DfsB family four-helix bundle protein [Arachnia propionica]|uniref:ClbS/DfsB family four-helix bundle protein n=1 Tax=Arachnia propionica TaxID=1750 RepID=UPI0030CC6DEB
MTRHHSSSLRGPRPTSTTRHPCQRSAALTHPLCRPPGRTYGKLNDQFWRQHQSTAPGEAERLVRSSHEQVMALIKSFSDAELFEKGRFDWTGKTTLGSYCTSATLRVGHEEDPRASQKNTLRASTLGVALSQVPLKLVYGRLSPRTSLLRHLCGRIPARRRPRR